jgi:hypothetical protein
MKKPHARWLTLHKADIDQSTSIEILWQTELNTLNILLFRIDRRSSRAHLTTETIGPYHSLADLRRGLCVLFGELPARRICHNAGSWLPSHESCAEAQGAMSTRNSSNPYAGNTNPQGHPRSPLLGLCRRSLKPKQRKKSATERLPAFGGQTALVAEANGSCKEDRGRESLPATINYSMIQKPRDPLPS